MDKSWIDRYFDKDLTAAEEAALLAKVAEDSEWREAWEFEHKVRRAVAAKERNDLKQFLQEVEARKQKRPAGMLWWAAASVLLLSGLWFFGLRETPQSLADAHFHPLPNMIQPVVRSGTSEVNAVEAFRLYDAGKYEEAADEFSKIEGEHYAMLYRAVSLMALDKPDEARKLLEGFTANDEGVQLEPYRKWYLALASIQTGNNTGGKALLAELAGYANPMTEAAAELLKKIGP